MNKNKKLLKSFTKYCEKYPDQRFWQALKNWAGVSFILFATGLDMSKGDFVQVRDTYNLEDRNDHK